MKKVVNSKLLNQEDLKDHIGVGVMIIDSNDRVLVLDHIKFNMITIPVGKGEKSETPFEAICKECYEETGIRINSAIEVSEFDVEQIRNGRKVKEYSHIFICIDYSGRAINKEPNKHRDIWWMPMDEFRQLKTISFMTNVLNDCLDKGYIIIDNDKIYVEEAEDRVDGIDYSVIYREHRN